MQGKMGMVNNTFRQAAVAGHQVQGAHAERKPSAAQGCTVHLIVYACNEQRWLLQHRVQGHNFLPLPVFTLQPMIRSTTGTLAKGLRDPATVQAMGAADLLCRGLTRFYQSWL